MTKLLRILTGTHAGAELRLGIGTHRIGADDDADIRISDWRGDDVLLGLDEGGIVTARRLTPVTVEADDAANARQGEPADLDEEPGTVILIEFVPMQFGDTVLCVGSTDAAWPSDLDLLSTLLVKPDETRRAAERSRRRKMTGIVSACAMLGGVIVIGCVLLTTVVSRAALPHDAGDLAQRVNVALRAAHMKELTAQARGSTVSVTGMVATPEEDTQVRKLLMRISSTGIVRRYDIAQNDVRNMEDSLAMPGVKVAYVGRGAFEISGKVANPRDVESALSRMRRDLGENVKDLRVRVVQSEDGMPLPTAFSLVMSSDDVRYAETPDGVKHIYTTPEAAAAASGPEAAASAPATEMSAADTPAAAVTDTPAAAAAASGTPVVITTGAARGVMQPVEDIAAEPPAPTQARTTAYLPLPK
ncbi:secretion protein [Paraburkholderia sp. DD10]|uniref:secretion protein n=1 Tax=Paraburkholderia sp. DD10 TaxID=3409691 RepID=UPI003BA3215A